VRARPPRLAEWLLAASTAERDRTALLGDLQEEFAGRVARHGLRSASRWYWRQTRASLVPNLRRRLRPRPVVPSRDHAMTSLTQDVRLALRLLARRPLISTVAVVSLAVGIGLSAGIFSLLEAVVLRPLPVAAPGDLRVVLEVRERGMNHNFTYPGFVAYREAQESFTDVVALSLVTAALHDATGSQMVDGELVSGSYFDTLGPRIRIGRGLADADNVAGAPPVAVLSDFEFRRLFGRATELGGRSVRLNGVEFAVVGVTAAPFRGMQLGRNARFWIPLVHQPVLEPVGGESLLSRRTASWLTVIGRIRPGVSNVQAIAELEALDTGLTQRLADREPRFALVPGGQGDSGLPGQTGPSLTLLLGAALLVLGVACANVAGLLLARAGDRSREIAVRAALGAGRWRVARLLLIDALAVGLAGTAGGVIAARLTAPLAVSLFAQFGEPVTLDVVLNGPVLAFAAAAGLLSALSAGMVPVLRGWRSPVLAGLADGGRSATSSAGARRSRRLLVTAQFALTLGVVAAAVLLVRSLANVRAVPTGLDVEHVALVSVNIGAAGFDAARTRDYIGRVNGRLAALPGVRAAGFGRVPPLGFGGSRMTVMVPGYTPEPDEDMEINYNMVSPEYFDALGIDLVSGAGLRPPVAGGTRGGGVVPIVVNETMARQYWRGRRAVGQRLHLSDTALLEVVGVARDVKYRNVLEAPRPSFYFSVARAATVPDGVFHVRTYDDPAPMLDALRHAVVEVDPLVPLSAVRTLEHQLALNINRERVTTTIGAALGATALLLSAVGLFAAMAGLVAARAREMGVRLALGAVPATLARLVLREGLRMALWGGAAGIALALWLGTVIESRLYGVGPFDPLSLGGALALLAGVALLAAWLPARRAARVDPVQVLRVE
jgi:predicted permease